MGVSTDSILLYEQGSQKKVEKISAKAVSNLSKYSIKSKPLRYESNLEIHHAPLKTKLHYPPMRMRTYITQDGYTLSATDDVLVYTINGWKLFGEIEEGDVLYTNGIDTPAYMDEESLRRLYLEENLTQAQIAKKLGVSERTIRVYVHKFGLEKGIGPKLIGENNPNWKGDDVSKKGGYERTHEKFNKLKTGVCSRCGRHLPTQLHHDDRNPINIDTTNLMELCDLCHASEHHGMVIKWVRPAKIVKIRYGGIDESLGFELEEGDNVVIEGFILKFPTTADKTEVMEKY